MTSPTDLVVPAADAVLLPEEIRERLGPDLDLADLLARESLAPATLRAYRSGWRAFRSWCESRRVPALPATPDTVRAYLADLATRRSRATVNQRRSAVRAAHLTAGLPDPTSHPDVARTLQGIALASAGQPGPRGRAPLLLADLERLCAALGVTSLRDRRDRALLLVGYGLAARRSEIAALEVAHVQVAGDGARVWIGRGKTDQEGRGSWRGLLRRPHLCPVRALEDWLRLAGITSGPILRRVAHGRVGDRALSPHAINRIVQRLVQVHLGYDPAAYGAHSLRAGFATEAARLGIPEWQIALQTGHTSMATLRRYVRLGTVLDPAANATRILP